MSLDYKRSVYTYRRDPSGLKNECRTSYGRMNEWQRDDEMYRSSFLEQRRPLCHEGYLLAGGAPNSWQGVTPKKVVEVMQAAGSRIRFIHNDLQSTSMQLEKPVIQCGSNYLPENYEHLLTPLYKYERFNNGNSCQPQQVPTMRSYNKSLAKAVMGLPPQMRQQPRRVERNNNENQQQQHMSKSADAPKRKNAIEDALLFDNPVPTSPRRHLSRTEVMSLERDNWKMIR